jgi:hypothetical protein
MMLILLDIDGVMVQGTSWKPLEILRDGFPNFTKKAILSLQRIISETNGSIVLTTSHKSTYSLAKWHKIFKNRGIDVFVEKLQDNTNALSRKEEILNWLRQNPKIEDFVIIDDDKSLNDLPSNIKERLVLTSSSIGLNDEHALSAIEILKQKQSAQIN